MSIFNRYLKEGPGVEKDAPQKHRFFLFFELFGRKFTKLILQSKEKKGIPIGNYTSQFFANIYLNEL